MTRKRKSGVSAETVDDFLAGQGLLGDAEELALKRVLV